MRDDEGVVYVACHSASRRVYHTDPDCRYVAQADHRVQTWQRETAEAWDLRECQRCAGALGPAADTDVGGESA
ncbi:hypothetical protein [Salinilacihabitans rarus]|uniref:hypothetical protein n=1 Tax=Salinilacihabitans rarus TaxID=2961596 RepID=UPI0020C86593|nr:hypothetical protein [Salinilacihabitans rarus]